MRGARLVLFALSALVGCDSTNKVKVDNPVFSEPPPRKAVPEKQTIGTEYHSEAPNFSRVNYDEPFKNSQPDFREDRGASTVELADSEVVATVNNSPIFASEILDRYGVQLARARQQVSPEEFQKFRSALIKQDLKGHIERKLLVLALRSTLKPERFDLLDQHIDQSFEKEKVASLKKQFNVNTKHELEIELNKYGTSLATLRNGFANQFMAEQYLRLKSKDGRKIGRQELIDYYQQHLDEYAIPGAVKWQQIVISRTGPGGERAALEKLNKVVDDLKQDVDFGDVARHYSDGPTAADGGDWGDWMQAGSLADKEIERALFELPIGVVSDIFKRDDSIQLVKVTARRDPGRVQFADAQAEIQKKLARQDRQGAITKAINELLQDAVVTTMFDPEPQAPAEQDDPKPPFK